MAGFTFSIDKIAQKAIRGKLKSAAKNLSRAQASAANRTATSTVAFFSKTTRKEVNVKAARLKKGTVIKRATPQSPTSNIFVSGEHIRLIEMGASKTKRGPVKVRVYKTSGRKVLKSAFMATMSSGHRGVFRRTSKQHMSARKGRTKHSEAIDEQFGPSIMNLWKRRDVAITRHALNTLQKELKRQIQFYRNRK